MRVPNFRIASATPEASNHTSREASADTRPGWIPRDMLPPQRSPAPPSPSVKRKSHNTEKQDEHATQSGPETPRSRVKELKRTLTLLGPKSAKQTQESRSASVSHSSANPCRSSFPLYGQSMMSDILTRLSSMRFIRQTLRRS
jgi:hypothetical protein